MMGFSPEDKRAIFLPGVQYRNQTDIDLPSDEDIEAAYARAYAALVRVGIDPAAEGPISDAAWAFAERALAVAHLASPLGETLASHRRWVHAYAAACEAEADLFERRQETP